MRLSRDNVASNAAAIADFLALTPADRAITTLPLHYCYGLSVLHSHLVAGASVVLTGLSVVDECFWDLFARTGATSFAGVPHTFDLLATSGFEDRDLPTLRQVTQAGGRLDPDAVRRWSRCGRSRGWDLVVMYGATEATARMAYLPPDLAEDHPAAIGVAVPGGRLRLDETADERPGVGELVYSGPNVMLGYADDPGRPGARPRGRPSSAPATSPARSTGCSRSSVGSTATARSSGCASTSTPSSAACGRRSTAMPGSSPPTARVHVFVPSGRAQRGGSRRHRPRRAACPPTPCASPCCRRCR